MTGPSSQDASSAVKTLADLAYEHLRHDIVLRRLAPSTKLAISHLRRTYQIGASPLREALSRLAADGLVTLVGQRGFRVAPVSVEDMQDITRMRTLLETEALRDSMARGDDDWEGRVVAAFHRLAKFEDQRNEDFLEWERRNYDFHDALVSACSSPRLLQMRAALFDQHKRYRGLSAHAHPDAPSSRDVAREHQAIFEAVMARDVERACTATRDHILTTARVSLIVLTTASDEATKEPSSTSKRRATAQAVLT